MSVGRTQCQLASSPRLVGRRLQDLGAGVERAPVHRVNVVDVEIRDVAVVAEVGRVANRVRQARTRLQSAGNADSLAAVKELAVALFGADEGVRYGRPGLQTQITYLAGMTTRVDQRIGRDAVERYQTLRKELDGVEAKVNKTLGAEK